VAPATRGGRSGKGIAIAVALALVVCAGAWFGGLIPH
jgi:hypothetical protein